MPIIHHIRKKKMRLKLIVFPLFVLTCLSFFTAQAEVMKTINVSMPTNYGTFFGEIHYSEKDLALALRVERIINEDLIKVINYFEYVPYDVVHFNIDPYTRLTNGSARSFPTNIINIYNFPASNQEHLIVMENWLQGLVLHEFVHITHLDQTRKYLAVGRQIFGTIAKVPAGIVPRWFTEGIAVWGESHLINGGRLNNPLFNKELTIQFKKHNFCKTIDCLDNPGIYPNGQLAYWAGGHFIEYLENKKPKTIKCLVEYNSGAIPFFLNDAFEACAGEKAQDLFKKFREEYIASQTPLIPEKEPWGEKISNAFGSDDYQRGFVLDHDRLFKVEHSRQSEAIVAYDLKDEVNFMALYDAPVADLISMVDVDPETRMLLVSFNDDPNFRAQNKVWKLINPDTLLVERVLKFPHDPSYVISLGGDDYLTFSYWENAWQIEKNSEAKNSEVLRRFPSHYNINSAKKIGDRLLIKMNDANGVSSLLLTDLNLQKLTVLYKSDKVYDLPLVTEKMIVVREGEELKLLELEKDIQISSLPKNLLEGITFADFNQERSLVLEDRLKSLPKSASETENIFKKNKKNTKAIELTDYQISPTPTSSYASEKAEHYPRLDHMIPHYWFLAVGNSDNLGSIGALTSFVDPMELHTLSATALVYPSESKAGGSLDYTQKMIRVSDLWTFHTFANQDYAKTDFNSTLILSRELKLDTSYKFLLKRWTYVPELFAGSATTEDFISDRTIKDIGMAHTLSFQALTYDDLFQYFIGELSVQVNRANVGQEYLATHLEADAGWRFTEKLMGSVTGSYGKLFKSDFSRGVIYGGGVSDYSKSRVYEFYGLPYSNAFGNEILTLRFLLDYNLSDINRGKNLFPFFLKEAHLLLGRESLYANRIFLDGNILRDKMINALFVGPRLKVNLFYYVPANIDLIFSSIAAPNGKNINQVDFSISASLF